jgi:integrase
VTLYGRDKYLGRHGTPESLARYRQIVAEWAVQNPTPRAEECHAIAHSDDLRTSELFLAYLDFAQRYYVKNGQPTGEVANLRDAIRPVSELSPNTRVLDFGPLQLKRVRERIIKQGLSRRVINARINRLRRIFKWGVENQLVPPAVLQALQAVSPLRAGRTEARERDNVRPVPMAHVDAIIPLVSKQVAAMIRLQLLTGMRPGEAVRVRANDLSMEGKTWTYRPASHKTEHHGIERLTRHQCAKQDPRSVKPRVFAFVRDNLQAPERRCGIGSRRQSSTQVE